SLLAFLFLLIFFHSTAPHVIAQSPFLFTILFSHATLKKNRSGEGIIWTRYRLFQNLTVIFFRKFICFSAECRIARPFIPMDLLSGTPTYFIYAQKERELFIPEKTVIPSKRGRAF